MTARLRVYIAGPYTQGEQAELVREAVLVGLTVYQHGHLPFIPHLYHFAHYLCPLPYDAWMTLDLSWLAACDAVVRLPGLSPGADREVERAQGLGLEVYDGLDDFLAQAPLVRWEPAERGS